MQPTTVQVWLEWTFATLVGYVVGIPIVLFISLSLHYSPIIDQATQPSFLFGLIGGAELGATSGIAQWLVLRRCTTVGWTWIAASIAGGALGMAPGMLVSESIAPPLVAAYRIPDPWNAVWQYSPMLALFGLGLGMAQWWLLRRHARFVGWWIAAQSYARPRPTSVGQPCLSHFCWLAMGIGYQWWRCANSASSGLLRFATTTFPHWFIDVP